MPTDQELERLARNRREWASRLAYQRHRSAEIFTDASIKALKITRDQLLASAIDYKLCLSGDWATVYTNDLKLIDWLEESPGFIFGNNVRQAEVTRPKDVIVIEKPKFNYRTYFRERKVDPAKREQLFNWAIAQGKHVNLSRPLHEWLKYQTTTWRSDWSQRYFYIEHNDLQYETMIAMIVPGLLRKTMPVISHYENRHSKLINN